MSDVMGGNGEGEECEKGQDGVETGVDEEEKDQLKDQR